MRIHRHTLAATVLALAHMSGCADDGDDRQHEAGALCEVPDECYPDLEHTDIQGQVECLETNSGEGYCTHHCETDADCCAVEGECETGRPQVCAPYTNSTQKRCFLACEDENVGDQESNDYCSRYAWEGATCASTGGGGENRKVCGAKG